MSLPLPGFRFNGGRPLAISYLPHPGHALVLTLLLMLVACTQPPAGSTAPQGTTPSTAPSAEPEVDGLLGQTQATLQHAIIPVVVPAQADVSTRLASASAFSYELRTRVTNPYALNDLVILPHFPPYTSRPSETDRYVVTVVEGRLLLVRLTGTRPLTQVKVAYSTDGMTFHESTPMLASDDKMALSVKWHEADPFYLRVRLDGFALQQTDGLRFSFGGNTVTSMATPSLVCDTAVDIAPLSSGPQPLETHLRAFLDTALGNMPNYPARMSVDYEYPVPGPILTKLPVLLAPNLTIDQASRSATVQALAQEIGKWLETTQPATNGRFQFKLDVLGTEQVVPLLRISNAYLDFEAISLP